MHIDTSQNELGYIFLIQLALILMRLLRIIRLRWIVIFSPILTLCTFVTSAVLLSKLHKPS